MSSSEQQLPNLPCCISHQFLKIATQNLKRIAVVHATSPPPSSAAPSINSSTPIYQGDQCFTYAQLLNALHSLTCRLLFILHAPHRSPLFASRSSSSGESSVEGFVKSKTGYRPTIVGVFMPPSVEYIVSVLSVLRCGEAFLPLDPSWPRQRVLSIILSSNVDVVITSTSTFGRDCDDEHGGLDWLVRGSDCSVLCFSMEEKIIVGYGDCWSDLAWPCEKQEGRSFCYLMYTSGSTGKPKGVCGTEQGLLNRFSWMQELYPLYGVEVLMFKTAVSFIDHLQEFLGAILTACVLVIPPFNELKENPYCLVNYLQAYSINRLVAVPSLMRAILTALQCQNNIQIRHSLKLVIVSGEVFPLSLWEALADLLPCTYILNLYGSTEVAGDCTYFDCKRLPAILEKEALTSVPIGVPIINCNVKLVGESETSNEGEIYVGGLCVSCGYLPATDMSFDYVTLHDNHKCLEHNKGSSMYFKTGDFARRLQSGDLVFVGRRDRTIKVNGQRISLDEIEITLREHPDIIDAAVILGDRPKELFLKAYLLLKQRHKTGDYVSSSIRSWMVDKVPLAMIPNCFQLIDSLPLSSNGKVDYASLANSAPSNTHIQDKDENTSTDCLFQEIKKVFCSALLIEEVSSDNDFFMMGGNSIAAAHISYSLGIDIRLLYKYPTPSKLHSALLEINKSCNADGFGNGASWKLNLKDDSAAVYNSLSSAASHNPRRKSHEQESHYQNSADYIVSSRHSKIHMEKHISSEFFSTSRDCTWATSLSTSFSLSRCNKIMHRRRNELRQPSRVVSSLEVPRNRMGYSMKELWKAHLESCVDASPLVVFKDQDIYVFIGSHAHKFVSIDAKSGSILWEVKLEGRIECSAAIVCDFSQVVVGCYMGKIYFLDFSSGNVHWTYQTFGEVKCQPAVDTCRELIWCGSHDHNLYGLDYKRQCCIFKLPCGGSIYGSPAIDEEHETLYVASTSGRVTAISLSVSSFHCLWKYELEVPVFGSLSVCSPSGNVVCCLVDGNIVAFSLNGCIIWRSKTGGPVFAGPCTSLMLPSQVLICSRNGTVYSFEMERGDLLWAYNIGDPITASAYVDEHLELVSNPSNMSDRLVSVCTSSGSIYLLHVNFDVTGKENHQMVKEFARLDLPGDIFSSPIMVGGRIFVGCRDDYVHCVTFGIEGST